MSRALDGVRVPDADSRLTLAHGLHALAIDYTRPEASVPFLRLSWERVPGGPLQPVGGTDVRWQDSQAGADVSSTAGRVSDVLQRNFQGRVLPNKEKLDELREG